MQKGQNQSGFKEHDTIQDITSKISKEMWKKYFKFSIVRNPWDMVVSRYYWQQHKKRIKDTDPLIFFKKNKRHIYKPRMIFKFIRSMWLSTHKEKAQKNIILNFDNMVEELAEKATNNPFYFDNDGKPALDYYLHFENIEEDYKKLCQKINIAYELLPRLKSKTKEKQKTLHKTL